MNNKIIAIQNLKVKYIQADNTSVRLYWLITIQTGASDVLQCACIDWLHSDDVEVSSHLSVVDPFLQCLQQIGTHEVTRSHPHPLTHIHISIWSFKFSFNSHLFWRLICGVVFLHGSLRLSAVAHFSCVNIFNIRTWVYWFAEMMDIEKDLKRFSEIWIFLLMKQRIYKC